MVISVLDLAADVSSAGVGTQWRHPCIPAQNLRRGGMADGKPSHYGKNILPEICRF
jgi:hypothetical protein